MSDRKNSANETDTESENEEPMPKRPALSRSNVSSSHSNGNQVLFTTENKSYVKSDDEVSPTKISSSDDDRPIVSIGPTSSSSSIELQVVNRIQSNNVKSSHNDTLGLKIENKIIQNVYRQDVPIINNMVNMETKDSGMSSCQESSQEFADGRIGRSVSSGSTQSFDSQYTESNKQTVVSDEEEDQQILQRAAEFTVSKNAKDFDVTETQLGICNFCMSNKKDGVFVHSNSLHLCCCYKCAVKVWKKRKCCPICNQKIKNVSKLFVH